MKYRYRAVCTDCREEAPLSPLVDVVEWQAEHDAKHERGKCKACGHWNDSHTPTDEKLREYLHTDQALCCNAAMGMGDFCGCDGKTDTS